MTIISVTNNGADDFSCKYDGTLYSFPAGESVPVPKDAAQHIFGLGKSDKQEVMARHGWLTHSSGLSAAHAKLNSFAFGLHKDSQGDIPALMLDELEEARQTPNDDEITPETDDEQTPEAEAEIIEPAADENEHGSAPVLTETGEEASTDGLVDAPVTATNEVDKGADEQAIETPDDIPSFLGTISLKRKTGA